MDYSPPKSSMLLSLFAILQLKTTLAQHERRIVRFVVDLINRNNSKPTKNEDIMIVNNKNADFRDGRFSLTPLF